MGEDMNIYEEKRKDAHRLLDSVIDTIIAKNTDYGDSFSITGKVGASTRIFDKAMRLHTLSVKNNEPQVKDEAIEDTAKDLFAYSLMYMLRFTNLWWNPEDDIEQQIERSLDDYTKTWDFVVGWGTPQRMNISFENFEERKRKKRFVFDPYVEGKRFAKEILKGQVCENFRKGMLDGLDELKKSERIESLINEKENIRCPEKDKE